MGQNLHVGTHKNSHPNYDKVFGVKFKFEVCRGCPKAVANGGKEDCDCSLVKKS